MCCVNEKEMDEALLTFESGPLSPDEMERVRRICNLFMDGKDIIVMGALPNGRAPTFLML